MAKKITQNVNKDAGLMDLPKVHVPHSQWESRHSNYITSNIGDIVPIYCEEVLASEKRKVTMGMLSHMTTPVAPIFNAQYTEFRTFFVPYRLCADLLAGYKTRKSPWVKVFGEDNASANSSIIVSLSDQKLPDVSANLGSDFYSNLETFGGVADALDCHITSANASLFRKFNFLNFAAYELIYQKAYRNENREAATSSALYRWLFDIYNRANASTISYANADAFHKANREKDYFTGCQPFTQKSSSPVTAGLVGNATVKTNGNVVGVTFGSNAVDGESIVATLNSGSSTTGVLEGGTSSASVKSFDNLYADLSTASGIDINQLRLMIKTQELLEKDMMYGSRYSESLNAHFGTSPISLVLDEPLELKKVTITSHMQPIFQTSATSSEPTILGTIGANATTQSGEFEICPLTEFKEHGLLMICAVHKAQNSYDSYYFKPKHIFKKGRFDFYTPELNDLGFQPVLGKEFNATSIQDETAVGYNEAFAEYRYKFNKVHGMFEPSRANALTYWTLALSNYSDVASLYKQDVTELDRAVSIKSNVDPQFFDAFGFVEYNDKPMSLHSIPGMDGVI